MLLWSFLQVIVPHKIFSCSGQKALQFAFGFPNSQKFSLTGNEVVLSWRWISSTVKSHRQGWGSDLIEEEIGASWFSIECNELIEQCSWIFHQESRALKRQAFKRSPSTAFWIDWIGCPIFLLDVVFMLLVGLLAIEGFSCPQWSFVGASELCTQYLDCVILHGLAVRCYSSRGHPLVCVCIQIIFCSNNEILQIQLEMTAAGFLKKKNQERKPMQ